jgi:hypothetical protein
MLVGTVLFAVVFFSVALIAFLIVLPFWTKERKKGGYYNSHSLTFLVFSALLGLSLIALVSITFPFAPKFWVYTAQTSTISSIENKVVTSADDSTSLTSEFVLVLEGDTVPVVLTDSRIQTYEAGDTINLNCSYQWVYAGMEVKNCKIVS